MLSELFLELPMTISISYLHLASNERKCLVFGPKMT